MADKKTIEVSDSLYTAFSALKVKVSELAKDDTITDEDLVGFMLQEISHGISMMEANNEGAKSVGKECCEGKKHGEDHECCGGGNCC